jgi:lipoprotein-anchoring transpeptidase ErfK/SrfK
MKRLSSGARINPMVLSQSTRGNTRLIIDIADQRGYLLVNGKVAVNTPVSTARAGKHTPRGSFSMSQRVRSGKVSTIYGVEMPYWMRLSGSVFGVHAGHLPGYPASAGCIRLPASAAQVIYDNTTYGTRVNVYSSWDGA